MLLYGELAPNVLRDLESTLSQVFTPLFKAREDWGKADPDLKVEFMKESEKFASDLRVRQNSVIDDSLNMISCER
jgi:dynein heavy chain